MLSIIWSIIICCIVYRLVKQQKNSSGGKNGTGGHPVINTTPVRHREQRNVRPVNQQLNRSADNQTKVSAPQRQMNIEQPEDEEISTMEYLEEKARQDAAEHARDKWEENMRLHQNYGGLRVAERLFDGDTVPGGKKCSVCEYCGAENLIPMIPRERYSCYFCREPLR